MAEHTLGKSQFIRLKDGRKLHYRAQGTDGPTVVFEAGMGFSSATWGLVQPNVSNHVTTVAYDRAGTGKSDWDSADRTIDRICDDLTQLLNQLAGPFILVGHSWGGAIVRRMAARRAHEVLALVLVDQTDERNPEYFTGAESQPNGLAKTVVLWLMHTMGLRSAVSKVIRDMPRDCRREIMWHDISVQGVKLSDEEREHLIPGLELLLEADDRLKGIDVTVISGTSPREMEHDERPPMVRAHRETAEALDKGVLVEAPNSGHFVPMTDAKIVANEILSLLSKHQDPNEIND